MYGAFIISILCCYVNHDLPLSALKNEDERYLRDVHEYSTVLVFKDRLQDRKVRKKFELATFNASVLGRIMRGSGALVYNEKRAYEIVQMQMALY